ncbi:GntR family transcriptional regulator [Alkalicoccobacillus murimartini]|uniref:DNA-binding transcriptional regulator YhcF (GntR family) n=1 Tax=Alkalicoccobacillus murimartini TaxID=171685 RepID=A0ABT9YIH0_9BACI|nr:GntR family transcriptional regulator [Alkalicoccobacillus murimartini]MDQ0207012.1 DNA-binding transcriptional regulator YhcF (GntR family) [Alkalicoccobacillus murimartini]
MTIEFDPSKPIYRQIAEYYYQQISNGELRPGDKLPSVRETAQSLRVNPNTASRSYLEMDRDGVTFTKRGQGTFVTEDEQVVKDLKVRLAKSHIEELIEFLYKLGFTNQQIKDQVDSLLEEQDGETNAEN